MRNLTKILVFGILTGAGFLPQVVEGTVIYVPKNYATIQEAVDACHGKIFIDNKERL